MPTIGIGGAMMLAIATLGFVASPARAADAPLSESQLVEIAIEANPAVKSARYNWDAALHSIKQTVAPNDPIFAYSNIDSVSSPFGRPALHSFSLTESFQFPGKALRQRDEAERSAEIAHLMLAATVRDVRAATETGYFQLVLDQALIDVNAENVQNLDQVVRVTETAYSGSAVPQTDVISAEFNLAAARQLQRQYLTAVQNDETALNLQLYRPVGEPLSVDRTLNLDALSYPLDALTDRAYAVRQEILEAALAERNSNTALYLAKMEYLPDFTAELRNDYTSQQRGASTPINSTTGLARSVSMCRSSSGSTRMRTWRVRRPAWRQRARPGSDQNSDRGGDCHVVPQRAVRLSNRDPLSRLADSAGAAEFSRSADRLPVGKIDFVTLSTVLQSEYAARVSYLQAANQFLAGEVSLEQAIGAPLHQ